ncbi:MAG: hypothetical protein FJ026_17100 [Chloroflexi bacterium]|nr:hypothetical protein [Chloroflexota bacterium]
MCGVRLRRGGANGKLTDNCLGEPSDDSVSTTRFFGPLLNHALTKSHARHFSCSKARDIGLKESGSWDLLEEFVKEPPARRMVWSESDTGGEADSVEIIQIGQNVYMQTGSEWLSMTTSEDDFFAGNDFLADPMGLVAGNRGKLVQRGVMVNGVSTDRYTFDETGLGAVSKATGEVWVSPTLNVVVKYTARFEGKDLAMAGGEEGWINVTLDLTDINQPIVKAPEGVGPALAEDIPVMEGATELTAISGMVMYKVAETPDEVRAFYEAEMPAKGWTKAEEQFGGMLSFTKGERQATVMIQEEDGKTAVSVFTEE